MNLRREHDLRISRSMEETPILTLDDELISESQELQEEKDGREGREST